MKGELPVILWHCGCQDYLVHSVKQCKKYNSRVILLGNAENQKLQDQIEWYDQDMYLPKKEWEHFLGSYRHMSTNEEKFEINCFKRFFAIHHFVKENGIDRFIYIDSDILCFCNFSSLAALENKEVGMGIPKEQEPIRWIANCGISLWTAAAMEDFLGFVRNTYDSNQELLEKKWNYHRKNGVPGGICDMTLEYLWYVQDEKYNKINLANAAEVGDGIFDVKAISSENYLPKEFRMDTILGIKKIVMEDGKAFFVRTDGTREKALGIHFLGGSKKYLPFYGEQIPIPQSLRREAVLKNIRNQLVSAKNSVLSAVKYRLG